MEDVGQYLASLVRVRALSPQRHLTAHGEAHRRPGHYSSTNTSPTGECGSSRSSMPCGQDVRHSDQITAAVFNCWSPASCRRRCGHRAGAPPVSGGDRSGRLVTASDGRTGNVRRATCDELRATRDPYRNPEPGIILSSTLSRTSAPRPSTCAARRRGRRAGAPPGTNHTNRRVPSGLRPQSVCGRWRSKPFQISLGPRS